MKAHDYFSHGLVSDTVTKTSRDFHSPARGAGVTPPRQVSDTVPEGAPRGHA
jgi:hypothetical protein